MNQSTTHQNGLGRDPNMLSSTCQQCGVLLTTYRGQSVASFSFGDGAIADVSVAPFRVGAVAVRAGMAAMSTEEEGCVLFIPVSWVRGRAGGAVEGRSSIWAGLRQEWLQRPSTHNIGEPTVQSGAKFGAHEISILWPWCSPSEISALDLHPVVDSANSAVNRTVSSSSADSTTGGSSRRKEWKAHTATSGATFVLTMGYSESLASDGNESVCCLAQVKVVVDTKSQTLLSATKVLDTVLKSHRISPGSSSALCCHPSVRKLLVNTSNGNKCTIVVTLGTELHILTINQPASSKSNPDCIVVQSTALAETVGDEEFATAEIAMKAGKEYFPPTKRGSLLGKLHAKHVEIYTKLRTQATTLLTGLRDRDATSASVRRCLEVLSSRKQRTPSTASSEPVLPTTATSCPWDLEFVDVAIPSMSSLLANPEAGMAVPSAPPVYALSNSGILISVDPNDGGLVKFLDCKLVTSIFPEPSQNAFTRGTAVGDAILELRLQSMAAQSSFQSFWSGLFSCAHTLWTTESHVLTCSPTLLRIFTVNSWGIKESRKSSDLCPSFLMKMEREATCLLESALGAQVNTHRGYGRTPSTPASSNSAFHALTSIELDGDAIFGEGSRDVALAHAKQITDRAAVHMSTLNTSTGSSVTTGEVSPSTVSTSGASSSSALSSLVKYILRMLPQPEIRRIFPMTEEQRGQYYCVAFAPWGMVLDVTLSSRLQQLEFAALETALVEYQEETSREASGVVCLVPPFPTSGTSPSLMRYNSWCGTPVAVDPFAYGEVSQEVDVVTMLERLPLNVCNLIDANLGVANGGGDDTTPSQLIPAPWLHSYVVQWSQIDGLPSVRVVNVDSLSCVAVWDLRSSLICLTAAHENPAIAVPSLVHTLAGAVPSSQIPPNLTLLQVQQDPSSGVLILLVAGGGAAWVVALQLTLHSPLDFHLCNRGGIAQFIPPTVVSKSAMFHHQLGAVLRFPTLAVVAALPLTALKLPLRPTQFHTSMVILSAGGAEGGRGVVACGLSVAEMATQRLLLKAEASAPLTSSASGDGRFRPFHPRTLSALLMVTSTSKTAPSPIAIYRFVLDFTPATQGKRLPQKTHLLPPHLAMDSLLVEGMDSATFAGRSTLLVVNGGVVIAAPRGLWVCEASRVAAAYASGKAAVTGTFVSVDHIREGLFKKSAHRDFSGEASIVFVGGTKHRLAMLITSGTDRLLACLFDPMSERGFLFHIEDRVPTTGGIAEMLSPARLILPPETSSQTLVHTNISSSHQFEGGEESPPHVQPPLRHLLLPVRATMGHQTEERIYVLCTSKMAIVDSVGGRYGGSISASGAPISATPTEWRFLMADSMQTLPTILSICCEPESTSQTHNAAAGPTSEGLRRGIVTSDEFEAQMDKAANPRAAIPSTTTARFVDAYADRIVTASRGAAPKSLSLNLDKVVANAASLDPSVPPLAKTARTPSHTTKQPSADNSVPQSARPSATKHSDNWVRSQPRRFTSPTTNSTGSPAVPLSTRAQSATLSSARRIARQHVDPNVVSEGNRRLESQMQELERLQDSMLRANTPRAASARISRGTPRRLGSASPRAPALTTPRARASVLAATPQREEESVIMPTWTEQPVENSDKEEDSPGRSVVPVREGGGLGWAAHAPSSEESFRFATHHDVSISGDSVGRTASPSLAPTLLTPTKMDMNPRETVEIKSQVRVAAHLEESSSPGWVEDVLDSNTQLPAVGCSVAVGEGKGVPSPLSPTVPTTALNCGADDVGEGGAADDMEGVLVPLTDRFDALTKEAPDFCFDSPSKGRHALANDEGVDEAQTGHRRDNGGDPLEDTSVVSVSASTVLWASTNGRTMRGGATDVDEFEFSSTQHEKRTPRGVDKVVAALSHLTPRQHQVPSAVEAPIVLTSSAEAGLIHTNRDRYPTNNNDVPSDLHEGKGDVDMRFDPLLVPSYSAVNIGGENVSVAIRAADSLRLSQSIIETCGTLTEDAANTMSVAELEGVMEQMLSAVPVLAAALARKQRQEQHNANPAKVAAAADGVGRATWRPNAAVDESDLVLVGESVLSIPQYGRGAASSHVDPNDGRDLTDSIALRRRRLIEQACAKLLSRADGDLEAESSNTRPNTAPADAAVAHRRRQGLAFDHERPSTAEVVSNRGGAYDRVGEPSLVMVASATVPPTPPALPTRHRYEAASDDDGDEEWAAYRRRDRPNSEDDEGDDGSPIFTRGNRLH